MWQKIKTEPKARVLALTTAVLLFFLIASFFLNLNFSDKEINKNQQYVVGKNLEPGRYLFKQKNKAQSDKLEVTTKINQKSFVVKQDKKFLDFFNINSNTKSIKIDYNDPKVMNFLDENTKINPYNQVRQFAYATKTPIMLSSSYHLGINNAEGNLIDNIELNAGDVVSSTANTKILSRFAPQHLFWDNISNSTIWVTFQAGVVVPLSMFIINYTFYLTRYGFTRYMRRNKLVQLLLSSTLGAMPGDATTLVLFPFYFNKIITWGSLVALSIAGIGDSGFILMSNSFNIFGDKNSNFPNMFVSVMVIKIIIAVVVGFILIKFNIDPKIPTDAVKKSKKQKKLNLQETQILTMEDLEEIELSKEKNENVKIEHISYLEDSDIDDLLHHNKGQKVFSKPNKSLLWLTNNFLWIAFWVVEIIKYIVFFSQGANVSDESTNPVLMLMSLITAIIVIVYWFVISLTNTDEVAELESSKSSFKQTITHSTEASVKIMFRVIVIMSLYKIIVFGIIGDSTVQAFFGGFTSWWILALLGVIVGIIPGCQLQIAFQTVAISLGWPLPAVLSNAISQIGDSAFSFLTVSKKAWFRLQLYNSLVALVLSLGVGYLMFGHF